MTALLTPLPRDPAAVPAFDLSAGGLMAFLEGAIAPNTEGKAASMDVGAGIQAFLAVDGAAVLTYLLTMLLSARPTIKLQVDLGPADMLELLGLKGRVDAAIDL